MYRQRPCRSTTVSSKMTHALMNVMAMAILAITGKGGVVDVFIVAATLGLEVRFKSSDFFFSYGEHDHWRSGSQDRPESLCNPVLREDWPAAQDSAHQWAAPVS